MDEFAALPDNLATEEATYQTAAQLRTGSAEEVEEITSGWMGFFRTKYERILKE